jgi:hypothetical protein
MKTKKPEQRTPIYSSDAIRALADVSDALVRLNEANVIDRVIVDALQKHRERVGWNLDHALKAFTDLEQAVEGLIAARRTHDEFVAELAKRNPR